MPNTFDPSTIPLPEPTELIRWSHWIDDIEGLRPVATSLLEELPRRRDAVSHVAEYLAGPQIDTEMVRAMARIGLRIGLYSGIDLVRAGLGFLIPGRRRRTASEERAVRQAERLVRAGGPAWVKLGQFVATANGIVPDAWTEAFAWCRDEVPALAGSEARELVRREFDKPIGIIFAEFDDEPLAAASIAQVHRAVLHDGREVVVKIQRPGLQHRFETDLRAMAGAARAAERFSAVARIGNISGFVGLFAQLVMEELDFRIEAANMIELGITAEHAGVDYVRFPRPIPGHIREKVLVMERLPGTSYTSTDLATVDREKVLKLAIQGVLEHTLVYGVFHGDLHAGNVLLDETGTFSLVDFGIVGRLNQLQRAALAHFLISFAQNDVRAQLEAMVDFGAIPRDADIDPLVAEIEEQIDPSNLPKDADTAMLVEAVGTLIRLVARHDFRLPTELFLFFKNLLYLNGFAAAVAPEANLLAQTTPIFDYFNTKYGGAVDLFTFRADPDSNQLTTGANHE